VQAGLLRLDVARPSIYGLEMHLARIHRHLDNFRPDLVVVDPISAFVGLAPEVHATVLRMMNLFKSRGTTALYTSMQDSGSVVGHGLSSLMDTWIKLIDIDANGERSHVLYVMKARGLSHSTQVREYLITSKGMELIAPYIGPDGVLTGTARAVQEAREQAATTHRQQENARHRRELDRRCQTLEAQIDALRATLADASEEATMVFGQEEAREAALVQGSVAMGARRTATVAK
jgi:circadian clock protein KaiC